MNLKLSKREFNIYKNSKADTLILFRWGRDCDEFGKVWEYLEWHDDGEPAGRAYWTQGVLDALKSFQCREILRIYNPSEPKYRQIRRYLGVENKKGNLNYRECVVENITERKRQ